MDAFLLGIFNSPITGWGAFGSIAVFMTVSIVRGWVIPGRTHDRLMALANKRGDDWKETAGERAVTIKELTKTLSIVEPFFQKISVTQKSEDQ